MQKLKSRRDKGMIIVGVIIGFMVLLYAIFYGIGTFGLFLGPDALGDIAPSWSPDSTRITFSSDETGDPDIYVMNTDGTGRFNLTNRDAKDIEPSWSPDGKWIAFLSRSQGNTDIHRVRPDGSGLSSLTNFPAQLYSRPIWSPDGKKIAFTPNRDADPPPRLGPTPEPFFDDVPEFPAAAPRPELYVMNADGSGQTRLTFNFFFDGNPSWSPDSQRLAFQSRGDGDHEIYVVNVDGTGLAKLTDNEYADIFPAWSPDGHYIAFSSNRPKTEFGREMSEASRRNFPTVFSATPVDFDIYIMNPDGSGTYNWTRSTSLGDSRPSWSPDGSWIAFEAQPHIMFTLRGSANDIYMMRFEGADLTNVTGTKARNQEGNEGPIVWSPDGNRIAFVTKRYGTPQVETVRIFNPS